MSAPSPCARRLVITGRVQGVGYRDWLRHRATRAGLSGWVRNRVDGSVEALLAGPEAAVAEMITACHRGPAMAQVADVAVEPAELPAGEGFGRLPTV